MKFALKLRQIWKTSSTFLCYFIKGFGYFWHFWKKGLHFQIFQTSNRFLKITRRRRDACDTAFESWDIILLENSSARALRRARARNFYFLKKYRFCNILIIFSNKTEIVNVFFFAYDLILNAESLSFFKFPILHPCENYGRAF